MEYEVLHDLQEQRHIQRRLCRMQLVGEDARHRLDVGLHHWSRMDAGDVGTAVNSEEEPRRVRVCGESEPRIGELLARRPVERMHRFMVVDQRRVARVLVMVSEALLGVARFGRCGRCAVARVRRKT